MSDLKAAIARAKANGPRKVDVHQDHLTGRTVSKRSKTGNPACSAAMSAWKLGRGTPEVHAMLAKCRAMAAGRRQAELSRAAGNEARAQHLEHRSKQGMTGKERLAKAKELAAKRRAAQPPAEKPAPSHRAPNDYEREALTKDRHTFLADQVVARTRTKAQRELTGGDGLIKTKEGYVPTRGGKPVSHYRPMDAAAAYDHMRRGGAGPLINQAESDRIDILTEFRKAGWKPPAPAQAEAPKAASKPKPSIRERADAIRKQKAKVKTFEGNFERSLTAGGKDVVPAQLVRHNDQIRYAITREGKDYSISDYNSGLKYGTAYGAKKDEVMRAVGLLAKKNVYGVGAESTFTDKQQRDARRILQALRKMGRARL